MSQTITHIDPLSTHCVLKHMGLMIDEIKLVRSIINLNEQMRMDRVTRLESERKRYLVSELRFQNQRLLSLREKANES